ncbi:aminotransferase class I/II-fold pyridoxal phosphate-dependent enzyme [Halarcobacter bivalviorum]|uniref:8-amino-7-oxononanoate synthase n=1 Tax=Halarcobacter bivalviorum TaxID=663364 RepID=A0AAX2A782_9BACT|nr:pyridoxal phosphate-dependent aminotransferase family protein [Halarcobacter bivalviorum]AXH13280.1 8-amino-7-oxononanoate synthase [Halarcobacter bivalviorum]RXK10114.1 8-amino-7-oxononanoate synthase [Halarcobacter bivalviorum]
MYEKELNSIKKANRYRTRKVFDTNLVDLASNDYLGLASQKILFENTYKKLYQEKFTSPKASIVVTGYSQFHKDFEDDLKKYNGFEDAVVVGSGFLANISMIEALVRKGDILFIDENYHASGMLATRLLNKNQVVIFKHNDCQDLKKKFENQDAKGRKIIAIEGVYSMEGDLAPKEIFDFANEKNALLIVDEAHSSGILGDKLLGIFDLYKIKPKENHIKMGTLGKAYGSYGAYILASKTIIDFLVNRAKAIIYTTAPSLFDIVLGHESLKYIQENKEQFKEKIDSNLQLVNNILGLNSQSLIIPVQIADNKKVLELQKSLEQKGYLVGAIRQPTVKSAIIRLIAKTDIKQSDLEYVCNFLKEAK